MVDVAATLLVIDVPVQGQAPLEPQVLETISALQPVAHLGNLSHWVTLLHMAQELQPKTTNKLSLI